MYNGRYRFDNGCWVQQAVTAITIGEMKDLMATLKLHYALLKTLGETDQLKEGMSVNGLSQALVKYPDIMKPLFIAEDSSLLTAGDLILNHIYTCSYIVGNTACMISLPLEWLSLGITVNKNWAVITIKRKYQLYSANLCKGVYQQLFFSSN